MSDIMGLIYTGERDYLLHELTAARAIAAIPICARYRLIDFIVSSMVNSGMHNIGVIMQKNYHSLMDHLGTGKEWDLHGKREGLVILPPFTTDDNVGVYSGLLDAIKSNLSYLRRSKQRYVVVSDSHMLYSAHFEDMVARHVKTGADITLMYTGDHGVLRSGGAGRYLALDSDGCVTDLEIDPSLPHYDKTYMDVFVIRREMLIDLADRAVSRSQFHLTRDLFVTALRDRSLKIYGYPCEGRVWQLDSVQAYYDCSMELLKPEVRQKLFAPDRPVGTKQRDDMSTHYIGCPKVSNSLLADGCIIEGDVENSILFRGVHVQKGAVVRNSVVMQDSFIMRGAYIENCILDKQTAIREDTRLIGAKSYPIVIAKNLII